MNSLTNNQTSEVRRIITTMTPPCYCCVVLPGAQSIPDAADTTVDFTSGATVEADTDSFFSTSDPDQITIPKAGFYVVTANVSFATDADGIRTVWVVNESTTVARIRTTSLDAEMHLSCAGGFLAAASDALVLKVRQSGGAALNLNSARLAVVRVGP